MPFFASNSSWRPSSSMPDLPRTRMRSAFLSDRPKVIPKHSTNLAFTGEFVEQPYQMIFTENSAVRSGEIAAFHFAGIPMSRLVKTPRYDKDVKTLLRAAKKMFD